MIKLSIVTATYNRVEKLARNIAGVLAQTCQEIEHIIVDNMSTDGTKELVEAYQQKAPYPVVYIREKDTGMYNAMNKGIKKANGEWIQILNSDDAYYLDRGAEKIIDKNHDQYDILCGSILIEESNDFILWKPSHNSKLRHYRFPHPGTIIKKEFYENHGYYSEYFKITSDAIFGIKHYAKANYVILDEILVIMGAGGVSQRKSIRNTGEYLVTLWYYHKFPISNKIRRTIGHIRHFLSMEREQKQLSYSNDHNYEIPEWWRGEHILEKPSGGKT